MRYFWKKSYRRT